MSRLHDQHRRLYATSDESEATGLVRALVIGLSKPADWSVLSAVWHGVQADLDLPAPGIVVNGVDGIELWLSVAEPQAREAVAAFAAALVQRYLPGVKPARLRLWPSLDASDTPPPLAPHQTGPERWAAFVAPDLAAVFADDPALDLPPGDDAQADLLSRLGSIPTPAFQKALARLGRGVEVPAAVISKLPDAPAKADPEQRASLLAPASLRGPYQDPRQFLLAVMNDVSVPLSDRIKAAKVLLTSQAPD